MSRPQPVLFTQEQIERASPPELHDIDRAVMRVRDRGLLETFRRLASDQEPAHRALQRQGRGVLLATGGAVVLLLVLAWLAAAPIAGALWLLVAIATGVAGLALALRSTHHAQVVHALERERDELADRPQDLLGVREAVVHSRACHLYRDRVVEQGRPLRRREAALLIDYADRESGGALSASARTQAERAGESSDERLVDPLAACGRFRQAVQAWHARYGTVSAETFEELESLRKQLEVDNQKDSLWYQRLQERKAARAEDVGELPTTGDGRRRVSRG